ncbi:hypothetical protein J3Q64DRAFT_1875052 [Phycomyces blakesleeanus]|uniref:Nucleoporin Nup188 N-terminal subdomain III domain-containing protein n=2 Tax=Phycomyces blakesleeanus TaxID=4837 RepID=A0A162V7M7_PHYB8|nr:hypothetical protein PHYBLDRAFT_61695 [Phycomyces blakesleeanus NRRL 1555(-)]OAD80643.1 hypothetical protein PHYBLDRAFT_61695 [Phycomyces blakesleeanus NRRL 1555(-)]|eukprot:XP_018298683.1 hypothetical protein PHYBLDRAFT_61695 [Phycomyces blakesleeanus NRRL 1555(-)]
MAQLTQKTTGPFQTLFDAIERSDGLYFQQGSANASDDSLQTLLAERANDLSLGLDHFTPPSDASQSKLTNSTTSIIVDKKTIKIDAAAKDVINELSHDLQLNQLQAAVIWDACTSVDKDAQCDLISQATNFYYQERLAILKVVSSMLRISHDDEHPWTFTAREAIDNLLEKGYVERILTQLEQLMKKTAPEMTVKNLKQWALQNVHEQKALLDILYLVHLNRSCEPQLLVHMIELCQSTMFGMRLDFDYAFEEEGKSLQKQVYGKLILTAVQLLDLNTPLDALSGLHNKHIQQKFLATCPDIIIEINDKVSAMKNIPLASVFLLGWSCFLHKLNMWIDKERPDTDYTPVKNIIKQDDNHSLDTTLATKSLELDALNYISSLLESYLLEEDPNQNGYRATIRTILDGLTEIIRPYALPSKHYDCLVDATCKLYKGQTELCEMFWEAEEHADAHSLLNTATCRFPFISTPLLRLLSSLTGSREDEDQSNSLAQNVFDKLLELTTLTSYVVDNVMLGEDNRGIYPLAPIQIAKTHGPVAGIQIDADNEGILLSDQKLNRIIAWKKTYSGWHLMLNTLFGFAEYPQATTDSIDPVLELMQTILSHDNILKQMIKHAEDIVTPNSQSTRRQPLLVAVFTDLLDVCTAMDNPSPPTLTRIVRCMTSLLPYYRQLVWKNIGASPSLTVKDSLNYLILDVRPSIQQIIRSIECKSGRYSLLLSVLDLIVALINDTQADWWETENVDISRKEKAGILKSYISYLLFDILPNHGTWRYFSLSERFQIGSKIYWILIYTTMYFKSLDKDLNELRKTVYSYFLYDANPFYLAPLLECLTEGPGVATKLLESQQYTAGDEAEQMVESGLIFTRLLLTYRLEDIARHPKGSVLEQLLLERTGNTKTKTLLQIAQAISYTYSDRIPTEAITILRLLAQTTSGWTPVPMFAEQLGDRDQIYAILCSFLEVAENSSRDPELLVAIWQMLTVLLKTQPSLAILFLDCGDSVMPSPKSAVKQQKTVESGSAVKAAVDLFQNWQMWATDAPAVLSSVLRFLATFWETAFDHYSLVQRTRSDNALWLGISEILLNPNEPVMTNEDLSWEDDKTSHHDDTQRACCSSLDKAFALQILTFEIHLTAHADNRNNMTLAERLPAGVKTLLVKMSEPSKLAWMRDTFIRNNFDPSLASTAHESSQNLVSLLDSTHAEALLSQRQRLSSDPLEDTYYGDDFLYDIELAYRRLTLMKDHLSSRYNITPDIVVTPKVLAILHVQKTADQVLGDLCRANHNYSKVDSDMILLEAFKNFIDTASYQVPGLIWANKLETSLFDFIMNALTRMGNLINRDDSISNKTANIIASLVRDTIEDWTRQNSTTPVYVQKTLELVSEMCALVNKPFKDTTRHLLLETILIALRSVRNRDLTRQPPRINDSLSLLLGVVCPLFASTSQLALYESEKSEELKDEAIKQSTVLTFLLRELVRPANLVYNIWLPILERHSTLPSLLKFIKQAIALVVLEIKCKSKETDYSLQISPCADNLLSLLTALSMQPQATRLLIQHEIFTLLNDNSLSLQLRDGTLETFIECGTQKEYNPLHHLWCHMLRVMANILHACPINSVIQQTLIFLERYGARLEIAFFTANGVSDITADSLSEPIMIEIELLCTLIQYLSKYLEMSLANGQDIFSAFNNAAFPLLRVYLDLFTHPKQLERTLPKCASKKATQVRMARISRTILLSMAMLFKEEEFRTDSSSKWPIYKSTKPPTIEGLINSMIVGINYIDQWKSQKDKEVWNKEGQITSISVVFAELFRVVQRYHKLLSLSS